MSLCVKCNKSIKPLSLATTVAGEKYHPTCISCARCDRPLWGKGFIKDKSGKLICEAGCEPKVAPVPVGRPASARLVRPPSSGQRQVLVSDSNSQFDGLNSSRQTFDPSMYLKQQSSNDGKQCKVCHQSVHSRRFVTYENGDVICQPCDDRLNQKPARVNSAHLIVCSACNKTLKGAKYFTESNGDIICDSCDARAARCKKCNQILKPNEARRTLANGFQYHDRCFDCGQCNKTIQTTDFYQTETLTPLCLDCYETSKLPKCSVCSKYISGPYLIIDNKPVHNECFKCARCSAKLDNETGFFRDKDTQQPICGACNIALNGSRCFKCGKVIEKDGVTFNDRDYHQECYTCDTCGKQLVRMKKTLTDKVGLGLYCEPCFVDNFAPKCAKCSRPIPPYLPGTEFEGKSYHKECFACSRCKKSLVNQKFFKVGNITVCEHCY